MNGQILHGGDLISASARYNIPQDQWLDLSTGINPDSYPVGELATEVFQRLPYQQQVFADAVTGYYGTDEWLAVNGSQPVIQALPLCLEKLPVLLPDVGYDEHRHHWAANGNPLAFYPAFDLNAASDQIERRLSKGEPFHLVVINPNNPTGLEFSKVQLCNWAERLAGKGCLIVDEAFIDTQPAISVLNEPLSDKLIVLRSFGKFFGLAGLRLGFVFASDQLRSQLQQRLGIWQVNGVAQGVATNALSDLDWQRGARQDITLNAERTALLLAPLMDALQPDRVAQTPLFSSWQLDADIAAQVQDLLAQQGVLVRLIPLSERKALLRTGIISRYNWDAIDRLDGAVNACIELLNHQGEAHV
ncbi:aminotransferase class I/II-fold pyridoxal phosphate-dependent enzyme [Pontibacterium granulatum]|uniref:aminotransferase class I/II-fold pyridoxal phosphate-dependent enzyme n=1 Tax=Pontibacterium granulatum TaxID=2036029 RepID=UPI00249B353C|nr:aminotransferase class I/II-fold pyridoxal phosphate-dependent enzyme [Pontibacterium granulatum]MDI3323986.1 aminotransferase class I/II-fold pyridoxal phosphate-dependent enzyme [Pontibacterium granulatum]